MLELMGMDDVVAGGEKGSEGKRNGGGGGGGGRGGVAEKRRIRAGKLPTRPLESIWTLRSAERSQGAGALHRLYKGAAAMT